MVSIIILNHNTPDLTVNCLRSILRNTRDVDFEIILVDNGSVDGSHLVFHQQLVDTPNLRLIHSEINLGFGAGNNLGAQHATKDFLFFLNSDTLFYENSLLLLLKEYKRLSQTHRVGFIQPRLFLDREKRQVQRTCSQLPTLFNLLQENVPVLQRVSLSRFEKFRYLDWDRNTSRLVDVICGAAMFCRKDFFQKIGCFDERFFLYFEEYDICRRAKKLEYENYYTTKTGIIHFHNSSINPNKRRIYVESLSKYIIKYHILRWLRSKVA